MTYIEYLDIVKRGLLYKVIPDYIELVRIEKEFKKLFPGNYNISIEADENTVGNNYIVTVSIQFVDIIEQVEWKLKYG